MRIDEIAIDGFGRFHNYRVGDLGPGLVVVQGANEAGKSTMLAFIQRVLFDFPRQRKGVNLYQPVDGGDHGGRLVLRDDTGERFVVERHRGGPLRVVQSDGQIGSDEVLRRILGGVEKTVYMSIFAFGLSELEDFQTIASDGVTQALFNATAGLGNVSLIGIRDGLDDGATALFKPGGHNPEINSLLRQIEEADATLRELQALTIEYNEMIATLESARETNAQLEKERADVDRALARQSALNGALPDWQTLAQAREDLALLPETTSFPDEGAETITLLQEGQRSLQEQLSKLSERASRSLAEEQAIEIDESLIRHREPIRLRNRQVERYRNEQRTLREARTRESAASEEVASHVAALGPVWDEARLREWGTQSGPLRAKIDQYEDEAAALTERRRANEAAIAAEEREAHRIETERADIQKQIEETSASLPAEEVSARLAAVTRLKAGLTSYDQKKNELNRLTEQAALRRETMPPPPPVQIPRWPAFLLGGGGLLVLIAGGLTGAGVLGAIACLVMLAAAGIYLQATKQPVVASGSDPAESLAKFQSLADLIATAEGELSRLGDRITGDARAVGINRFPDAVDVAQVEQELLRAERSLEERARLDRELHVREAALKAMATQIKQLVDERAVIGEEETTLRETWSALISPIGLSSEASPKVARDQIGRIEAARSRLTVLDELRGDVSRLSASIGEFEASATQLLEDCGRPAQSYPGTSLDLLVEECETAAGLMETRVQVLDGLVQSRKRDEAEMKVVEADLAEKDAAIASLLSAGQSTTVEEFLQKAKDWQTRTTLLETIRSSEQRIRLQLGTGADYDAFIEELASAQQEELRLEIERIGEERTGLAARKAELDQEIGRIKAEIARLETSQEQSRIILDRATKTEQLESRTLDWIRLVIAQALLEQTVAFYEQERQPGVVRRASEYLQAITAGRYLRIQYPLGASQPVIVEAGERQKGIDQLSRGLAGQVYLAIRFGYIDEYTETAQSLPVIFDDVLVNFDSERSRQACRAIGELARRHQVLYFTCHPETEAMLTEEVPGAVVVNLTAGAGSA